MSDPKPSFEPLLDSDQAAAILHIHPKTLQRLARRGRVPEYRIGNLWRFHASDLQASMIGAVLFNHHSCPQLTGGIPCLFGRDFNMAVYGCGSGSEALTCGSFVYETSPAGDRVRRA